LQPYFPPKEAAAESNLFAIFGKTLLVAGRDFCFLQPKAGYHSRRLGNWN
jgi:hypothetical protein